MMRLIIFLSVAISASVYARKGFGPGEQDWGYIQVRDKSYMFWWLYYTSASSDVKDRPLIIWLQGGPGGSSTGLGNFNEIGPWDAHLRNRSFSWVNFANILFVDNPVGTGFSYTQDGSEGFAKNNTAIAQDFVTFLKTFFENMPDFRTLPMYIFGQSYGGKMAVDIALLLVEEIKNGSLNCKLRGVGLGDAWISPLDSLMSWPDYLFNLGFIDSEGSELVKVFTSLAQSEYSYGRYVNVTKLFLVTQIVINNLTNKVNFYNVLTEVKENIARNSFDLKDAHYYLPDSNDNQILEELMNTEVKAALNINETIRWSAQRDDVFKAVEADMMLPVTESIERILNETDLTVTVYNGQLDLIVSTPGTLKWIDELKWKDATEWRNCTRKAFAVNGIIEGYQKNYGNLHLYWVNRAGHSVPADNPGAMEYILRQTTNDFDVDN